jgi:hypothetical protein
MRTNEMAALMTSPSRNWLLLTVKVRPATFGLPTMAAMRGSAGS